MNKRFEGILMIVMGSLILLNIALQTGKIRKQSQTIDSLMSQVATLEIDKTRNEIILDMIRAKDSTLVENAEEFAE